MSISKQISELRVLSGHLSSNEDTSLYMAQIVNLIIDALDSLEEKDRHEQTQAKYGRCNYNEL